MKIATYPYGGIYFAETGGRQFTGSSEEEALGYLFVALADELNVQIQDFDRKPEKLKLDQETSQ